jgi:large subunit ribosomal protein L9
MSKKVTIILLEDLSGYGKAGDIIDVSEGYARNFLFPQSKAALATTQVKEQSKRNKAKEKKVTDEELAKAQKEAESIEGTELLMTARIKEGEEIFGKIAERDISKALKEQVDKQIDARDVKLEKPITSVGTYDVTVVLPSDIEAKIKVSVEADPDSLPKEDE